MEEKVIGVRLPSTGKLSYYSVGDFLFNVGDLAVVETERGLEIGRIVCKLKRDDKRLVNVSIASVVRPATKADKEKLRELKEKSKLALDTCKSMVKRLKLDMKLITASYTLDESKLIFYFTAEERVDFRELVKELASQYKTRIELRQVGARDEVKEYPMLGVCGRELCCRTFLPDFESVTIKTAKEQGLQINMQKLSGCCGKLKCCIKYEEEAYKEKMKGLPKVGEIVEFEGEKAKVVSQDILSQKVKLKIGEPGEERFVVTEVENVIRKNNKNGEDN